MSPCSLSRQDGLPGPSLHLQFHQVVPSKYSVRYQFSARTPESGERCLGGREKEPRSASEWIFAAGGSLQEPGSDELFQERIGELFWMGCGIKASFGAPDSFSAFGVFQAECYACRRPILPGFALYSGQKQDLRRTKTPGHLLNGHAVVEICLVQANNLRRNVLFSEALPQTAGKAVVKVGAQ